MIVKQIGVVMFVPLLAALGGACGGGSAPTAAVCIKAVEESGQTTDECLPVALEGARVDLGTPAFTHPTPITNPLHPTSLIQQTIYGGQVEGKPFRTEVTLLPRTTAVSWRGGTVETALVQYVAYLDGRIHEVALDRFAQADDGSVWYFGEDVYHFEDGKVADTNGTWVANDRVPPAMIMPTTPRPGNVYRPENAPGVVFEEVTVGKVDQEIDGPSGKISGAIEVEELHLDGTREGKVFAPGYGEFSTGSPGGDLEAVSLALPTDTRQEPPPTGSIALSDAVHGAFDAAAHADVDGLTRARSTLDTAWDAVAIRAIPPRMAAQMRRDLDALDAATSKADWPAAQSSALRVAQNELDLRLLYHRAIDVDRSRLALWARQLPVDVAADDPGAVHGDVAALNRVWERTRDTLEPTSAVDAALQELRRAADAGDLPAVDRAATTLDRAVTQLHAH